LDGVKDAAKVYRMIVQLRSTNIRNLIDEVDLMYYVNDAGLSCFLVIKAVLDELYEKLPVPRHGKTKDEIIQEKLVELRKDYDYLPMGKLPDYTDLYKRFAYLYCYVPAHANILYRLIDWKLGNVFNENEVKVSCFGGGPGSDLLGIVKFMVERNKSAKLRCNMYDKEEIWCNSLRSICKNTKKSFSASSSFNPLDITIPDTWVKYSALWDVDLFTMSYFVSEVCPMRKQSEIFFTTLFERAKKGSHFLLVDNCSGKSHYWFDSLIENHNEWASNNFLELLGGSDNQICTMTYNEQRTDLGLFYEKFKDTSMPKTLGKEKPFVYRIYRKN